MRKMTALYIFLSILAFGFLIFIHESGHYLFARLFKVKINEFSIGMGPAIFSKVSKKNGIKYSFRALPIGGYVAMAGETEDDEDENAFYKKPVWNRIIITLAGAMVNIVFGILLIFILIMPRNDFYTTQIESFTGAEGYTPTTEYGLEVGDTIISVNGSRVYTSIDLQYEIYRFGIEPVDVVVERDGERLTLEDVQFPTLTEGSVTYGARDFYLVKDSSSIGVKIKNSLVRSEMTVRMVYDSLFDLIRGRYSIDSVSGPVGVTKAMTEAAGNGPSEFFYLVALIAINLGIMNLLPLPALDGGRIITLLFELITRKRVPAKVEGYINAAGLVLLFGLMIVITFKDIIQIF